MLLRENTIDSVDYDQALAEGFTIFDRDTHGLRVLRKMILGRERMKRTRASPAVAETPTSLLPSEQYYPGLLLFSPGQTVASAPPASSLRFAIDASRLKSQA